jgi:predicted CXXCH cytochrome family protein
MKKIAVFSSIVSVVVLFYCCVQSSKPEPAAAPLTYTGSEKCQSCHAQQYSNYQHSDHFHAMDSALPRSVRGNFNNSYFIYFGDTSFFYQRDGRYYVRTKDVQGRKAEFMVSFTFGWRPLQQYLVRFADGRIQTLPFCWDTRDKEKGGQKWFHIYNKEKILPGDELYWTGENQNWNNMCADCHTTNFFKKFDVSDNTFHSQWSENRVSCESCHGPASGHLLWVDKKYATDSLKGFAISLNTKKVVWKFDTAKGIAYPDQIVKNNTLIETCARCHARATRLSDHYYHGQSFLQTHIPSTINTTNYYVDGQIKQEDYEFGSFLQSKMYSMGVACSNCHDPHSMELKASGKNLCFTCHAPQKFDVFAHTHHRSNSPGSECVNCHMPVSTYMVVDDRRDHSIRIPRPDLSEAMDAPNACNKCHSAKSVQWAAKNFLLWYGDKLPRTRTYGELLNTTSKATAASEPALHDLLSSTAYPAIAQATALSEFTQFNSPRIVEQVRRFLQSADPLLRFNALRATAGLPPEVQLPLVVPLLNDPVLSVRTEAMNTLSPLYGQLDLNAKQRFDEVLAEYLEIQRNMCDRPEGYLNQGIILTAVGRLPEAEQVYLLGLRRFPKFVALYANTADLYRAKGEDLQGKEYIEKGLLLQPNNPTLHYSLALWWVRNGNKPNGILELRKAIALDPKDPTFTYAYASFLQSTGHPGQAIETLETFVAKNGNDPLVINELVSMEQDSHRQDQANFYLALRKNIYGY